MVALSRKKLSSYDPRIDHSPHSGIPDGRTAAGSLDTQWRATTRRWISLLLASCFVLSGAPAAAAPPARTLGEAIHVRPGVTCLDGGALREQVRSWMDADSVGGDLRVEVEGSDRDARFASFRIWRGERLIARRRFAPGPSQCAQMHAIVGLAIALALKVSLRDELFGELAPRPSEGWSVGAAASAARDAALWLEKALPEHFAAHLELSGLLGGDTRFEQPSGSFTTSSVAVEAAACVVPAFGESVHGRFCAGLEARALLANGSGFAISKDAVLDWFSLANSAGLSIAILPKWALVGTAGLVVPLERVQIAVVEPGGRVVETHDASPAGGSLSLGTAYEF